MQTFLKKAWINVFHQRRMRGENSTILRGIRMVNEATFFHCWPGKCNLIIYFWSHFEVNISEWATYCGSHKYLRKVEEFALNFHKKEELISHHILFSQVYTFMYLVNCQNTPTLPPYPLYGIRVRKRKIVILTTNFRKFHKSFRRNLPSDTTDIRNRILFYFDYS